MFLAFAAVLVSATIFAQTTGQKAQDLVKFKESTYDFGKIKQGTPVTHEFVFTNVSNRPVTIENATATCGCTTPVWPAPPVAKGKTEKITAGFNAAAVGPFTKSIYVKLAGIDVPVELRITGEVLSPENYSKLPKGSKKG